MAVEQGRGRATMKQVAALAGVSLKTVSRVVNGEPFVSPEVISRVQDAAQRLNYRPNLTASSLRRADGRTRTVGLLLENVANPFSAALHRAIEDVARERGVVVLAGSVDEDPVRERELVTAFSNRRVDGLIVVPSGGDQSYLAAERSAGTALVFVDRPPQFLDADVVLVANRAGAEAATTHLIEATAASHSSETTPTSTRRPNGSRVTPTPSPTRRSLSMRPSSAVVCTVATPRCRRSLISCRPRTRRPPCSLART